MRNGKALIDKIEYFMKHPEDEHSFCTMFSKEERDIWKTIREFEQIRSRMEPDRMRDAREQMGGIDVTERIFQKREREREISFLLKGQLTRPRQHRHLKRKDSIRSLVLLVFSVFFIFTG